MRDLSDTTTIQVIREDKELIEKNVPGKNNAEKIFALYKFYIENFNVTNIDWMAKEIRRQLKIVLKEEKNG